MKIERGWAFPSEDEFMCRELKDDGTYQGDHYIAARRHVRDWSCAIDAGSHCGTWSKLMAAEFARVIAVEPSPDTAEALAANIATFGLMNVEIRQVAVGRAAGLVHMVLDAANVARKNTGARHVEPGGQIPCERIDDWQLETLGFLKLDIEGSEPDALEGATETIQRCQPAILYEDKGLWKRFGKKRDAVARLLTRLGYHEIDRCGSDAIWGPR